MQPDSDHSTARNATQTWSDWDRPETSQLFLNCFTVKPLDFFFIEIQYISYVSLVQSLISPPS